jgi:hypothetical protein
LPPPSGATACAAAPAREEIEKGIRGAAPVLWSLCLPTVRESESDKIDFEEFRRVDDVRSLLVFQPKNAVAITEDHAKATQVLKTTYRLLRNLHRTSAVAGSHHLERTERTFGAEYDWYLRGYDFEGRGRWGPEWGEVWATPSEPRVRHGTNPLSV